MILDNEAVDLRPSKRATKLDADLVATTLREVGTGSDSGEFPFAEGEEAAFTTDEVRAMGPISRMSAFTTEYPPGEARVTNIHLIADTVDGAIVWPGETFSLNDYVGRRTTEKGYVPAPMILGGDIVDDIGGGVSQFATTFYNAVFFGCYEDVVAPAALVLLLSLPGGPRGDDLVAEPRSRLPQRLERPRDHRHLLHVHVDHGEVLRQQRGARLRIGEVGPLQHDRPDTVYEPDPLCLPARRSSTQTGGRDSPLTSRAS